MTTTIAELTASIESLGATAVRIKEERDLLLAACTLAIGMLDNVYDVDQPEPGKFVESPFSGAGDLLAILKRAVALAKVKR